METTPVLFTPIVTSAEAAELLGVSRFTVIRWTNEGHMHPARTLGSGVHAVRLFTVDEIERVRATPRPRKPRTPKTVAA